MISGLAYTRSRLPSAIKSALKQGRVRRLPVRILEGRAALVAKATKKTTGEMDLETAEKALEKFEAKLVPQLLLEGPHWEPGRSFFSSSVRPHEGPGAGSSRLLAGFLVRCDPEFRECLPLSEMDPALIPTDLPYAPWAPRTNRLTVEEFPVALAARLGLALRGDHLEQQMAEVSAGIAALSEAVRTAGRR